MKPLLTSNLKIKFLGITPVLKDETGVLSPQEIVVLSSYATFKGKSIKNLLQEIKKSGENLKDRVKKTLMKSSLPLRAKMPPEKKKMAIPDRISVICLPHASIAKRNGALRF